MKWWRRFSRAQWLVGAMNIGDWVLVGISVPMSLCELMDRVVDAAPEQ